MPSQGSGAAVKIRQPSPHQLVPRPAASRRGSRGQAGDGRQARAGRAGAGGVRPGPCDAPLKSAAGAATCCRNPAPARRPRYHPTRQARARRPRAGTPRPPTKARPRGCHPCRVDPPRRSAGRLQRLPAAARAADPVGADDDRGRRAGDGRADLVRGRLRDLGRRLGARRHAVVLGRAPLRLSGAALPLPRLALAGRVRPADRGHLPALGLLLARRLEVRARLLHGGPAGRRRLAA